MTSQILVTKLFIPPARPRLVLRPELIGRLNKGYRSGVRLSLISAPAGFGKTTLVSDWLNSLQSAGTEETGTQVRAAWLSLDEGDNDPVRFLEYVFAALRTVGLSLEVEELRAMQSPHPPDMNSALIALINELAGFPDRIILALDDYHLIEAQPVYDVLSFLLENMPSQMHVVIATREDPHLPLSRLRVRGQLSELRAADLRFTSAEAAEFLNQVMGLDLSPEHIAALEARTEGWVAGLQLAALSMRDHENIPHLVKSFTGSHRLVLDYLIEEVLSQQSQAFQDFLLQTSILDRLTGSLCDAVTGEENGQATLEMLERANLFVIPLDDERHWYRYHHLFAELLRQRLQQVTAFSGTKQWDLTELHKRAGIWFEKKGLLVEAFHHASAANDVARAERLVEGGGLPLHLRGMVTAIISWLESLPAKILQTRPSLRVMHARLLLAAGLTAGVEEILQAAESALAGPGVLQNGEPDAKTRDLIGRIASYRATLAFSQHQAEDIIAHSRRALAYLHPDNLHDRSATIYKLGYAHLLQGDRSAAGEAYREAMATSEASGHTLMNLLATAGLAEVWQMENRLHQAAETYQRVLEQFGDQPLPTASDIHLALARISYEWNDLEAAQKHAEHSLRLARQFESIIDRYISSEVFLARLKLARGDINGASALLAETWMSVQEQNFTLRVPETAAAQAQVLLHQGDLSAAAALAEKHELPIYLARVRLAQGDASAALSVLEGLYQQAETKGWEDEKLKVTVLQALALHAQGETKEAASRLRDALVLTEPEGFIRIYVDEGPPMSRLLYDMLSHGAASDYVRRLLTAFPIPEPEQAVSSKTPPSEFDWVEPLSERETEVLQLIAQGLTNPEIAAKLFLSLHTVKAHNRNIYSKLGVSNRVESVSRGRALGILPAGELPG